MRRSLSGGIALGDAVGPGEKLGDAVGRAVELEGPGSVPADWSLGVPSGLGAGVPAGGGVGVAVDR